VLMIDNFFLMTGFEPRSYRRGYYRARVIWITICGLVHQIKVIELRNIIRMRGAAIMRKTMCLCYFICVLTRVPATRKKRRGMRRLCFCCDVPHHGSDDPKQSTKILKNKKKMCFSRLGADSNQRFQHVLQSRECKREKC
jgi:hypothetical protein